MSNKVKFGLKNVHYAPITVTDGAVTYGTPVKIPGGVSLNLDPKGDRTDFYADDMLYFTTTANNGYEGDLEVALIPDSFKVDVLGYKEDANGVLFEDSQAISKDFALLFEFKGDKNATRHVLYNVNANRPNQSSTTKGETVEVQTETLSMTASPATDTGYVKAKAKLGDTGYDTWYNDVYIYVKQA